MRPVTLRFGAMLAAGMLVIGCGGAAGSAPPSAAPASLTATAAPAATPTSAATTASSAPAPSAPAPAIVGAWAGMLQCQRIMDVLTAAGMPEQGLLNIVDVGVLPGVSSVAEIPDPAHPCVGAVEVKHSHFFTAAGEFGSRDSIGTRVDDGKWSLVDQDTILIGGSDEVGSPFDFTIDGASLELTPVDVGTCPTNPVDWCLEAWKLMVAQPGLEWQRSP